MTKILIDFASQWSESMVWDINIYVYTVVWYASSLHLGEY